MFSSRLLGFWFVLVVDHAVYTHEKTYPHIIQPVKFNLGEELKERKMPMVFYHTWYIQIAVIYIVMKLVFFSKIGSFY